MADIGLLVYELIAIKFFKQSESTILLFWAFGFE